MLVMLVLPAFAADPVRDQIESAGSDTLDIGVLQNSEVKVVQKMLYRKEDRLEVGGHLGVMPFDGYTVAPQLALTGAMHQSENLAFEAHVAGGYGFPSAVYDELGGPVYGVAVEAYRYLASAEADVQWTPIYAKMNFGGKRIIHHDVYVLLGAGATVEQAMIPTVGEDGVASYEIGISPTVPVGIGTRIFVSKNTLLRAELRDSMLIEHRAASDTWGFKQNVALSLGVAVLLGETR